MLKRSSLTIYMAQKSDTFGKDSEASVALGQGKTVIVFVPKLSLGDIDSERIWGLTRGDLEAKLTAEGGDDDKEPDPTMDQDALASRLLAIRLSKLDDADLCMLARSHWADFDLYGEDHRIGPISLRRRYREWLDASQSEERTQPLLPT